MIQLLNQISVFYTNLDNSVIEPNFGDCGNSVILVNLDNFDISVI